MFSISYNRPYYNPNRSYFRNANRYVAWVTANSKEEVAEMVKTIESEGGRNIKVYNNVGTRIA